MTRLTADDMFDSLTGFDEIAVAAHFGDSITGLAKHAQPDADDMNPFPFLRALIFVDKRREGLKDREAFEAAQELTIRDTQSYFPDSGDEDEAGKEPSA